MSKTLPVKGLAELDRFLSALPKNLQKGAYRAALTAAAKPVTTRARQLALKASGKMAKSVKTGSPRQNEDGTFSISIRLTGEHSYLGYFHEYGVLPHLITAGDSKLTARALNKRSKGGGIRVLDNGLMTIGGFERTRTVHTKEGTEVRTLKIGPHVFRDAVMHPGHRASPFMRPALDMEADNAVRAFADRIRAYIEGKTGFVAPLDDAA